MSKALLFVVVAWLLHASDALSTHCPDDCTTDPSHAESTAAGPGGVTDQWPVERAEIFQPLPTTSNRYDRFWIRDIWMRSEPDIALAVGFLYHSSRSNLVANTGPKKGFIARSTDGGQTWSYVRGVHDNHFHTIWVDGNDILIGGENGRYYRSTDRGRTLTLRTLGSGTLRGFGAGEDRWHVFCSVEGLFVSTDRGETWSKPADDTAASHRAQAGTWATGHSLITGSGVGLERTYDDGETWFTAAQQTGVMSLAYRDRQGLAVGADGLMLRSSDNGVSWQELPRVTNADLFVILDMGSMGFRWVGGSNGTLLRSSDYGDTWHRVNVGRQGTIMAGGRAGLATVVAGRDFMLRSVNESAFREVDFARQIRVTSRRIR